MRKGETEYISFKRAMAKMRNEMAEREARKREGQKGKKNDKNTVSDIPKVE